jgi:hypothetical protein
MEMPVVEVRDHGLWLLAKNVSIYCYKLIMFQFTTCATSNRILFTFCTHIYQVNQYIHRILVEADSSAESGDDLWSAVRDDLWSAVGEAGGNIYKRGDLKESQMADLDVYLLKKVERYTSVYNYQV